MERFAQRHGVELIARVAHLATNFRAALAAELGEDLGGWRVHQTDAERVLAIPHHLPGRASSAARTHGVPSITANASTAPERTTPCCMPRSIHRSLPEGHFAPGVGDAVATCGSLPNPEE